MGVRGDYGVWPHRHRMKDRTQCGAIPVGGWALQGGEGRWREVEGGGAPCAWPTETKRWIMLGARHIAKASGLALRAAKQLRIAGALFPASFCCIVFVFPAIRGHSVRQSTA